MGAVCCRCCFSHGSGFVARLRLDWGRVFRVHASRYVAPQRAGLASAMMDPLALEKRQGGAGAKRDGAELGITINMPV